GLSQAHAKAGLSPGPGRERPLVAAVLPFFPAEDRIRYFGLLRCPPLVRNAARLPGVSARGPSARPTRHYGARAEPHIGPASLVPARSHRSSGYSRTGFLRLERFTRALPRRPNHLQRLRSLELDLGRNRRGVLLAPLLFASAGPQLRQPGHEACITPGR